MASLTSRGSHLDFFRVTPKVNRLQIFILQLFFWQFHQKSFSGSWDILLMVLRMKHCDVIDSTEHLASLCFIIVTSHYVQLKIKRFNSDCGVTWPFVMACSGRLSKLGPCSPQQSYGLWRLCMLWSRALPESWLARGSKSSWITSSTVIFTSLVCATTSADMVSSGELAIALNRCLVLDPSII